MRPWLKRSEARSSSVNEWPLSPLNWQPRICAKRWLRRFRSKFCLLLIIKFHKIMWTITYNKSIVVWIFSKEAWQVQKISHWIGNLIVIASRKWRKGVRIKVLIMWQRKLCAFEWWGKVISWSTFLSLSLALALDNAPDVCDLTLDFEIEKLYLFEHRIIWVDGVLTLPI